MDDVEAKAASIETTTTTTKSSNDGLVQVFVKNPR